MNEKNFDYLKDNLKYHGFGEGLTGELEAQLKKGALEFTLPYKSEINKKEIEATLYFKKGETDVYFFNKYDARTVNEKDATMAQTFYLNDGRGVTLKEAYNLLNGRAVFKELTNKEDQKYKAWIQLDLSAKDEKNNYERKLYNTNYGYDLKETLSFYPVKEMRSEESMKDLIKSLEKGNVQMVTIEKEGKDVRIFIEANPKYKSLNIFDNKMVPYTRDQRQGIMVKPEMKTAQSQEQSQGQDQSQSAKKNIKAKLDDDLDTGKKKSRKKGLGV